MSANRIVICSAASRNRAACHDQHGLTQWRLAATLVRRIGLVSRMSKLRSGALVVLTVVRIRQACSFTRFYTEAHRETRRGTQRFCSRLGGQLIVRSLEQTLIHVSARACGRGARLGFAPPLSVSPCLCGKKCGASHPATPRNYEQSGRSNSCRPARAASLSGSRSHVDLVAPPGVEPGCLAAVGFKPTASAIPPRGQLAVSSYT